MSDFNTKSKCRICDSESMSKILPLKASPIADAYIKKNDIGLKQSKYDLSVFLCRSCGLVQLITVINPSILYNDFLYKTDTSLGLTDHFMKLASKMTKKLDLIKGSLVVDIGSNDGSLLLGFKNNNMVVLGVEPACGIAKDADDSGIRTWCTYFSLETSKKILDEHGRAKVINCNNTFANIDEINDFVDGFKYLLDNNGTLIIETSYIFNLIDSLVFDTIYHEHLSYCSLTPLEYLFNKHRLKVVDVETVDTKGGSIRCYIEHDIGQDVSESILEMRSNEKKLYSLDVFNDFAFNIEKQKDKCKAFLEKNNSTKIYGYGASHTTTTMLFHYEIYDYIEKIIDDNEIKIGRLSPYSHIPVVSSKLLYSDAPDFVVIFAWRFSDYIIEQHKKYLENGGIFIIPLPEFRIIKF